MIKLYDYELSGNCYKLRLFLNILGLAYERRGKRLKFPPNDAEELLQCRPIYRKFPGWQKSTSDVRTFKKLPLAAQKYLRALSELTGARLMIVSVGAQREQTFRGPADGTK